MGFLVPAFEAIGSLFAGTSAAGVAGSIAATAVTGYGLSKALTPKAPQVAPLPKAPNIDTADNAAQQQMDQMRKRRGVMANIYGGAINTPAPTAQKQLLGT